MRVRCRHSTRVPGLAKALASRHSPLERPTTLLASNQTEQPQRLNQFYATGMTSLSTYIKPHSPSAQQHSTSPEASASGRGSHQHQKHSTAQHGSLARNQLHALSIPYTKTHSKPPNCREYNLDCKSRTLISQHDVALLCSQDQLKTQGTVAVAAYACRKFQQQYGHRVRVLCSARGSARSDDSGKCSACHKTAAGLRAMRLFA